MIAPPASIVRSAARRTTSVTGRSSGPAGRRSAILIPSTPWSAASSMVRSRSVISRGTLALLRIVSCTSVPAASRSPTSGVSKRSNGTPLSEEMRSPGKIPAFAAGDPGCTSASRSSPRSASGPASTNISANATRRLTTTPASMTSTFDVSEARSQPSGSLLPSVAPAMRTKPPNGSAFRVRRVRAPRCSTATRGGKPIPNSSTAIPLRRATKRCPSSWTTINGTTRRRRTRKGPRTPPTRASSSVIRSDYARCASVARGGQNPITPGATAPRRPAPHLVGC